MSNNTKVWVFLVSTCILMLIASYELAGRIGLFIGLLLIMVTHFIIFFYGENRLLETFKAQHWKGQDPWGLLQLIHEFSDHLKMSPPEVYVYESKSANAFFLGTPWKDSCLAVSTGLLQSLTHQELRAIIALQLCRLQKSDHFLFVISGLMANTLVGFGELLDRLIFRKFIKKTKRFFFRDLFAPLAWVFIKIPIRSSLYFENDTKTNEIFNLREDLASALWKIEHMSLSRPQKVPSCTSHLFIVNPEGPLQKNFFLKSHPPTTERIKRLIGSYPI